MANLRLQLKKLILQYDHLQLRDVGQYAHMGHGQ